MLVRWPLRLMQPPERLPAIHPRTLTLRTTLANKYFVNTQVTLYGSFAAPVTTTLSQPISDPRGVTVQVASAVGFPTTGSYLIVIDGETMIVTAGQGTTTWTVTRSAIVTHVTGAAVIGPGAAADPTTVTCAVKDPTGVITSPATVKDNVGNYHALVTPTVPGTWAYDFQGVGVVPVQGELNFQVLKSEVI